MKVNNANARATIVETKPGAVYLTLHKLESEHDRLGCAATDAARRAAGIDSPDSDARRAPLAN